jgi:large subunit ribosomal protein L32
MPLPKRRTSSSKRDMRRSHHRASVPPSSICPHCHQPKMPHRICPGCGYYRGRKVAPAR